jgi:predicted TIM-barrel fold metal-dependent hydrolase
MTSDALPAFAHKRIRRADAHVHVYDDVNAELVLDAAARFGVERLFVSCLGAQPMPFQPTLEECRQFNRVVGRAITRYPGRVLGYCYANPRHGAGAVAELRTCVEDFGMRGLKLWMACYCDDEQVFPLVEQAIAYDIPVLIHTWSIVGGSKENESEASHVACLAKRYPEVRILMAHMSGDWLRGLKAIRAYPNVRVDTSGLDPEEGQVETAVAELGAGRVLFGSDMPIRDLGSQLAKILGAGIDELSRACLLWDNLESLLGRHAP